MLMNLRGKVVSIDMYDHNHPPKNSNVNNYYVLDDIEGGIWFITHHFIKEGERQEELHLMPANIVGLRIVGMPEDFRKSYYKYSYDDFVTTDQILAMEHAARENIGVQLDIEHNHREIMDKGSMDIFYNGKNYHITKDMLLDLLSIDHMD